MTQELLNEILAPHYYNGDKSQPLRVFVKDLATIFFKFQTHL